MPICPVCGEPIHQSRSISWVHDDGRSICSQAGAAAAFSALVKERDELSAVVEKVREWRREVDNTRRMSNPLHEELLAILLTAPVDALAEHDAALIESLADDMEGGFNRETLNLERRQIKRWLRGRARQARERDKK